MLPKKVDFIIVGQGLAGSILSYQLLTKGKTVLVIDNHRQNSSSEVAAGIINPITGPRLTLSDDFSYFYTNAKTLYQTLETKLNVSIWSELSQQRLLKNAKQFDFYKNRLNNPKYKHYLDGLLHPNVFDHQEQVIKINQNAVVDSKRLLNEIHTWLTEQGKVHSVKLNYEELKFDEAGVQYANLRADKIIFCEGYQAIQNPWLKNLPFLLSKGEILTLNLEQKHGDLLNWGNWLVPIHDYYKLGANYEWDNLDLSPTKKIKQSLLDSLNQNFNFNVDTINHEAGIRPTTKHRQPFIGPIKSKLNAYCFNGFGSKGCLIIPSYANLLTDHLCHNRVLPKKVTNDLNQCH